MSPSVIVQPDTAAITLAMAMVESSTHPLLLLDGTLCLIAVSASFWAAFQMEPEDIRGHALAALGSGEWAEPRLSSLLKTTAAGHAAIDAYQMDLKRAGRPTLCLMINAQSLRYGAQADVRLLVTIEDITDKRAADKQKDNLLREKAILLQELQHRVANSLQIIASVLMQGARKVASEEARGQLIAAHNRVISVAAIQKHLAPLHEGDVALKPYFTDLCESIGASMIHDHKLIKIEVSGDDGVIGSDTSVSLGLIVTELVINALKHAFPEGQAGKIDVVCASHRSGWHLSVSDNGIGMPPASEKVRAGLGSTIVKALVDQLNAQMEVTDNNPGTMVTITHKHHDNVEALSQADEPV